MRILIHVIWLLRKFFDYYFNTSKAVQYHIKKGYRHRRSVRHFDDTNNRDEYQNEVYRSARQIFDSQNYRNVLDIGCGSGFKLVKYFDTESTIGVEVDSTYNFLVSKYADRKWINIRTENYPDSTDLIILSDVIEHVSNPADFFEDITNNVKFKKIIISTPERDLFRGINDLGPPKNIYHYREWNVLEFQNLLSEFFEVEKFFLKETTQIFICNPKHHLITK